MPIRVVPRRSVRIEAWDATEDDLLRVETADGARYYLRARARFGYEPSLWFDPEFVPVEVQLFAKSVVRADIEWRNRDDSPAEPVTDADIEAELEWSLYSLDPVDYDRPLTVCFTYAIGQARTWTEPNHVLGITWITREEARKERDKPKTRPLP